MGSGHCSRVRREVVRQTKKRRSRFIKYAQSRAGRVRRGKGPIERCAGVFKGMSRGLRGAGFSQHSGIRFMATAGVSLGLSNPGLQLLFGPYLQASALLGLFWKCCSSHVNPILIIVGLLVSHVTHLPRKGRSPRHFFPTPKAHTPLLRQGKGRSAASPSCSHSASPGASAAAPAWPTPG